MGSYLMKILFAVLVCILHNKVSILGFKLASQRSHVKCIERERQALLNFKQGLTDPYGMLSTWKDGDNNRDCCKWEGIQCNNETGYVQTLDLHASRWGSLSGNIDITASLLELQNMEYLDLSYNYLSGSLIPQHMGFFKNLRYLNLSWLYFEGRIPHQLANLSKLEFLDLKQNFFDGKIPFQLGMLTNLQYLDLSDNYHIYGEIPNQLGNLSLLRHLDLSEVPLSGAIPFEAGNLPNLHTLRLTGSFSLKINNSNWLSSLSSLTTLDLSSLHNLGSSHHWLQIISELIPNIRELRLVACSLSDDSISSLFPSHSNFSTSLSILDLSANMLTSSTFQLLLNHSHNLHILDLSSNNLTSFIFQGNFNLSSKLQELHVANCDLTDSSFLVPSAAIKNSSSSLVTLNLGTNLLKSSAIYHWIFNFTTNLHSLDLHGNLLEGPIPDEFGKVMKNLEVLFVGSNKLQGEIPPSIGNICTLQQLDLGNNNLSGEISSFIQNSSWCNRHVFQILDLSSNRMTGMLPNLSIFTSLRGLVLSNNLLTGEIPKSIGLLYEMEYLRLEENHLEGNINELHLTNLSKLEELDLTDNLLSLKFASTWVAPFQLFKLGLASVKLGPSFPSWLETQSRLSFLDISDAGIDDFAPEWFWNKLQSISGMNISYNRLKGEIPNLPIKLTDEKLVFLNSNQLEGRIPTFLLQADTLDLSKNKISDFNTFLCGKSAATNMRILDLSDNQIMGQLPDCFEDLKRSLEFLDLSNNKFSGKIPQSIGTLVNLQALVLRNNRLTGDLPSPLKNCTSLVRLDVSVNLLTGPIPSWIGESLQQLKILSLRVNHFYGSIPVHLCYLSQIHLLDLSGNNLSGGIPTCLTNFSAMIEMSKIPTWEIVRERKVTSTTTYQDTYDSNVLLMWKGHEDLFFNPEIFLKSIDLSSNFLTGEIPKEFGYLLGLISLNLARNNLHGEIPSGIGNLNYLDFLDLSRNHFSGKIPSTLSKIDGLGYLNLSNNDLSGRIPWVGHLQNFDASSFEGNTGLCGQQLNKSCPGDDTGVQPQAPAVHGEDDSSVFYERLYMSLGIGFFVGFWGLLGPILLWQPWRNAYGKFLNILTDYILVRLK